MDRPFPRLLLLAGLTGLAAGLAACAGTDDAEDDANASAIVGDVRADGEQPAVVRLAITPSAQAFTCTGTLIGPRTVVTARHCVEGRVDASGHCPVTVLLDRVGAGTTDPRTEKYAAERCDILTPDAMWLPSRDVATVKLAKPIPSAALASLADDRTPSGHYDVFGYGSWGTPPTFGTTCEHPSDGHKRKASYVGRLGFRFGQSTCPGDSGGPHFVAGTSVLAGLTSQGYAVGVAYETNTSIADHRAWLLAQRDAYER